MHVCMYRELAQYVAPKRKAVEVTGDEGGSVKTEITISAWLDSINGKSLGPRSERHGFEEEIRKCEKIERRRGERV